MSSFSKTVGEIALAFSLVGAGVTGAFHRGPVVSAKAEKAVSLGAPGISKEDSAVAAPGKGGGKSILSFRTASGESNGSRNILAEAPPTSGGNEVLEYEDEESGRVYSWEVVVGPKGVISRRRKSLKYVKGASTPGLGFASA